MKKKVRDTTVKIDAELLKAVKQHLQKPSNKYTYVNKKQFINKAVFELLQKEEEQHD